MQKAEWERRACHQKSLLLMIENCVIHGDELEIQKDFLAYLRKSPAICTSKYQYYLLDLAVSNIKGDFCFSCFK